ncbi:uncharacterized protein LTR77_006956 [Saxophila tyrrhenica]|uniref:Uncharacterized protein n=1 Tax=Saxophila tyrrhenica TaxID=1690608 RepID=A0AAV9PAC8_9PEZI|nr:hypothetical protein LTR77_006956 [Saxophila tyrrhenica]
MFLKNSKVPDFIALHEGSIREEKTQPTMEFYSKDKYPWFGDMTSQSGEDLSLPSDPSDTKADK